MAKELKEVKEGRKERRKVVGTRKGLGFVKSDGGKREKESEGKVRWAACIERKG